MKIKTFGNEQFKYAGVCKNKHELRGKELEIRKDGGLIRTIYKDGVFTVYKGNKRLRNVRTLKV